MSQYLPPEQHYARLDRKTVAASVLFRNSRGEILVVKPNYAEGWNLPGGSVDANESPKDGAKREVKEELGLEKEIGELLLVYYRKKHGVKPENIHFLFDGGKLLAQEIDQIKLQMEELDEYQFVSMVEALKLSSDHTTQRLQKLAEDISSGRLKYLEDNI